jgi:hypothetical protein
MRFLNRASELHLFTSTDFTRHFIPAAPPHCGRNVPTAPASQRARSEMFRKPSVNSQRIRNKEIRQRVCD